MLRLAETSKAISFSLHRSEARAPYRSAPAAPASRTSRRAGAGAAAVQQRARTAGRPLRSCSLGLAAPRPAPSRISVRGAPSRRSRPAGLGQRAGPGAGGVAPGRLRAAAPGTEFPGAGWRGEPGRAALRRRHRALPARRERLTNLGSRRPLRAAAAPGEPLRCAGARGLGSGAAPPLTSP